LLTLALGLLGALTPVAGQAAVPSTLDATGTLTSALGTPAADGNYTANFTLYGGPVGGSALWYEGGVQLTVKNGAFNYTLGAKTPLTPTLLASGAVWLGVQIGQEPELTRRQLQTVPYALRASVAEGVDCSGCVAIGALSSEVQSTFAKKLDLPAVASTGSYKDLKDLPKLADVAMSGAYGDLINAPVLAKLGTNCGTGLVLRGFKADGSVDCAVASLPVDGLATVSNGLLTNQFVSTTPGKTNVAIPDGIGAGVTDTISFPDVGVAQKLWIQVDLTSSNVANLSIELFGPSQTSPYVLYKGTKTGTSLSTKFNLDTPIATGDINADWSGKNPAGVWSIVVKDPKSDGLSSDGKFSWSLAVQTVSSQKVEVTGNLVLDKDLDVAGNLRQGGQPLVGNFKYAKIAFDYRNNNAAAGWVDIPQRTLTYTKVRADSLLRVSYQDTLGTLGTSYAQCMWRFMVDSTVLGAFSAADLSYGAQWRMQSALNSTIVPSITAGSHTIKVQSLNQGATECLMGWNTGISYLSVEEVGP
jgi:subtilisin-like proprotein convertase family protein